MRTAILIRGHHFYDQKLGKFDTSERRQETAPNIFDYRICYDSIIKNIINPIINLNSKIDIYISTYKSEIDYTLKELENFKDITLLDIEGMSQMHTMKMGLDLIKNDYDTYIILRFDLLYKKTIVSFNWNPLNNETIHLTWKETETLWDKHNRIGDALFIINGKKSFENFKLSINNYLHTNDITYFSYTKDGELYYPSRSAHYLYEFLDKNLNNIKFLVDGYYDTGTSSNNTLSNNPIYVMYGRPYFFNDYPI
jgi:hypothetical protein